MGNKDNIKVLCEIEEIEDIFEEAVQSGGEFFEIDAICSKFYKLIEELKNRKAKDIKLN